MADQPYNGLSQKLSNEFKNQYGDKRSAIKEHVEKVKEILEGGIKSGAFRAIPVTTRMKEFDSALNSLQRKQKARFEREHMRERLRKNGGDWGKYWTDRAAQEQIRIWESSKDISGMKERRIRDQISNFGVFKSCDSMINALHDLGGVRVCVYFPHDVKTVLSFLDGHNDLKILWVTRKTQRRTDLDDLRSHVNVLDPQSPITDQNLETFVGYRATHAIIELVGTSIPEGHEESTTRLKYKLPGQNESSDEEKGILDLFNGLVLSGEAALNQLATCTARQENDRAREQNAKATSHHELGAWLASYLEKNQHYIRGMKPTAPLHWHHLDNLFDILRSSGDHTPGELNKLLNKLLNEVDKILPPWPSTYHSDIRLYKFIAKSDLPLHLLKAKYLLAADETPRFSAEAEKDIGRRTRLEAEYLAFRVASSVNMALYLGVGGLFLENINKILPDSRPHQGEFLALLHPRRLPLSRTSERKLIEFCQSFLDIEKLRSTIKDDNSLLRAELPLLLTDIGRIASPAENAFFSHEYSTTVPRALYEILSPPLKAEDESETRSYWSYYMPEVRGRMWRLCHCHSWNVKTIKLTGAISTVKAKRRRK